MKIFNTYKYYDYLNMIRFQLIDKGCLILKKILNKNIKLIYESHHIGSRLTAFGKILRSLGNEKYVLKIFSWYY